MTGGVAQWFQVATPVSLTYTVAGEGNTQLYEIVTGRLIDQYDTDDSRPPWVAALEAS